MDTNVDLTIIDNELPEVSGIQMVLPFTNNDLSIESHASKQ